MWNSRRIIMAVNLIRFRSSSAGLKATSVIVLVHKLTQRVLTSSMSVHESTCGRVYISECFFLNSPVLLEWKWPVFEVFKCLCVGSADGSPVHLSICDALFIKALLLSQTHKSEWAFGSKVMLKSTRIRLCYTCRVWPVMDTHSFTSIAALCAESRNG